MAQCVNPVLPVNEYIPDCEAHVFEGRVYLFGSHDQANGTTYCSDHYVFWSADLHDLSQWSNRGISYRAEQDPLYSEELKYLFAPDCVRGNDGRFYLYYCLSGEKGKGGYSNPISCAVSSKPDGPYVFHGYVKNQDGTPYREKVCFDPAVINDEGTIRIYFGTDLKWTELIPFSKQKYRVIAGITGRTSEEAEKQNGQIFGAYCAVLEDDMLTLHTQPVRIDDTVRGKEYRKHAFFEASSIRKINGMYYFVYSSVQSHELCLLTSAYPDRNFEFRGTIISSGDIGYKGRKRRDRTNFTGNNHGSIEEINGQYYIFCHRSTNLTDFSRQVCAEKIEILNDGSVSQVQMTSSGLGGGVIEGEGRFPAGICCSLKRGHMPSSAALLKRRIPYIASFADEQFIRDIGHGTQILYRSFHLKENTAVLVRVRGEEGILSVSAGIYGASVNLTASDRWKTYRMCMNQSEGIYELCFKYRGKGKIELLEIGFES